MSITNNPLRYPGAKRTLVDYVDELLLANNLHGCCFFEPYAGSAVVGLELLKRQSISSLVLCEKDILLYSFWECVFHHTEDLCIKIQETPITIEKWHELEYLRHTSELNQAQVIDIGFAGLFFNRTNFSGILTANPIGGLKQTSEYSIDCRFNKINIIKAIKQISEYGDKIEIYFDDALRFMTKQNTKILRETCFAYFDPPYYEKGSQIYRHYYKNEDHLALSRYVRETRYLDWLVSYDDAPYICGLYGDTGAQYRPLYLDYSCASRIRKRGQELLISNLPLPPFPVSKTVDF
jgi:DNA adenine methylase